MKLKLSKILNVVWQQFSFRDKFPAVLQSSLSHIKRVAEKSRDFYRENFSSRCVVGQVKKSRDLRHCCTIKCS